MKRNASSHHWMIKEIVMPAFTARDVRATWLLNPPRSLLGNDTTLAQYLPRSAYRGQFEFTTC